MAHLIPWAETFVYKKLMRIDTLSGRVYSLPKLTNLVLNLNLYKTLNEWARLFDCSTEQIKNGFVKIFTSLIPSQKWGAWMNGQHKPGWDDEPGFW
jgi:hypothetical protein